MHLMDLWQCSSTIMGTLCLFAKGNWKGIASILCIMCGMATVSIGLVLTKKTAVFGHLSFDETANETLIVSHIHGFCGGTYDFLVSILLTGIMLFFLSAAKDISDFGAPSVGNTQVPADPDYHSNNIDVEMDPPEMDRNDDPDRQAYILSTSREAVLITFWWVVAVVFAVACLGFLFVEAWYCADYSYAVISAILLFVHAVAFWLTCPINAMKISCRKCRK